MTSTILVALLLAGPAAQRIDVRHELARAQVAAAESALRLGEDAVAREWLDAVEPARRGFEWQVHDASLDEALETWRVDGTSVTAFAPSADGTRLACGLDSGEVALLSLQDGRLLARGPAHAQAIASIRFDGTGERLVATSFDKGVSLHDGQSLALLRRLEGHSFAVGGSAFSPSGQQVATSSYERPDGGVVGNVRIWDPATGALVTTLTGGRKPLVKLDWSPDGRRLAAASWDFCLFVWTDLQPEPVKLAVPDEGIYNAVDDVTWSPDGRLVAGASKDKTARVWSVPDGALIATLRGHVDHVSAMAFSPDGTAFATASADGTLRLWDTTTWESRAVLRGHADDVRDVAFTPDGQRVVSASADGTLRTWDAKTTWHGGTRLAPGGPVYGLRFSPDGLRLATGTFDGRVQVWDATTWAPLAAWQAHPEGKSCHALDWTPDGTTIATGSWDGTVALWDVATQSELARLNQDDGVAWLRISPDGRTLAAAAGRRVLLWDLATRERRHVVEAHAKSVMAVNFSPDSKTCLSAGRDGHARAIDVATGQERFSIEGPGPDVSEAIFTPDGRQIIVADRGGRVSLHRATTGSLIRVLGQSRQGIHHVAVSPDGRRAAIASEAVVLVDLADSGLVGALRPHVDGLYGVDFDPRGFRLASCAGDGSVAISDTRPLRDRLAEARATADAARVP